MTQDFDPVVRMIPVKQIVVLNPRERGKFRFAQIVTNIARLGLKKPVTVTELDDRNGQPAYGLVCGQGRLEAYLQLGQEEIPALLIRGTREDLLLMSLAENLARRQHSAVELVREVGVLKERGYSNAEIARKTDLNPTYVGGILKLLAKGEDKLLQAVEKGQIPISVAITIATSDDKGIQQALTEAYERNDLRGRALIRTRRLIESRRTRGKRVRSGPGSTSSRGISSEELLKAYQKETIRQGLIIQRAKVSETRLLFATSALKQLFQDGHFVTLLRAEKLDTLPHYLATQFTGQEISS